MSNALPHSVAPRVRPEKLFYAGSSARIGSFRAPVGHPAFGTECQIGSWQLVAFPRTSVVIEQFGHGRVVSDPQLAMLYNKHQRYQRQPVSADGDRCEWFAYHTHAVHEALGCEGFSATHARIDASTYLRQRFVFTHAQHNPGDSFALDEGALAILDDLAIVVQRHQRDGGRESAAVQRRHRELADAARTLLATRFRTRARLDEVAAALGCSTYHLCHVFRRVTGSTLSRYLTGLRLRAALERLADSDAGLTDIGLELGFSSHSHFTSQFSRVFGMPPRAFRVSTAALSAANKNLKALLAPTNR